MIINNIEFNCNPSGLPEGFIYLGVVYEDNSLYDKPIQIFETSEEELVLLFQKLNNIDSNKNSMSIYGPDNIGSIRLFIKHITI